MRNKRVQHFRCVDDILGMWNEIFGAVRCIGNTSSSARKARGQPRDNLYNKNNTVVPLELPHLPMRGGELGRCCLPLRFLAQELQRCQDHSPKCLRAAEGRRLLVVLRRIDEVPRELV